jgi:hypothetical protein
MFEEWRKIPERGKVEPPWRIITVISILMGVEALSVTSLFPWVGFMVRQQRSGNLRCRSKVGKGALYSKNCTLLDERNVDDSLAGQLFDTVKREAAGTDRSCCNSTYSKAHWHDLFHEPLFSSRSSCVLCCRALPLDVTLQLIYPFTHAALPCTLPQVRSFNVAESDEEVGYYAGLIASAFAVRHTSLAHPRAPTR